MKNPLKLSLSFLIGLTLLAGIISYFELIPNGFAPILYLGIALGKFILVAFEFMDLRKAHKFWKVSTLLIALVLVTGIAIFTFG